MMGGRIMKFLGFVVLSACLCTTIVLGAEMVSEEDGFQSLDGIPLRRRDLNTGVQSMYSGTNEENRLSPSSSFSSVSSMDDDSSTTPIAIGVRENFMDPLDAENTDEVKYIIRFVGRRLRGVFNTINMTKSENNIDYIIDCFSTVKNSKRVKKCMDTVMTKTGDESSTIVIFEIAEKDLRDLLRVIDGVEPSNSAIYIACPLPSSVDLKSSKCAGGQIYHYDRSKTVVPRVIRYSVDVISEQKKSKFLPFRELFKRRSKVGESSDADEDEVSIVSSTKEKKIYMPFESTQVTVTSPGTILYIKLQKGCNKSNMSSSSQKGILRYTVCADAQRVFQKIKQKYRNKVPADVIYISGTEKEIDELSQQRFFANLSEESQPKLLVSLKTSDLMNRNERILPLNPALYPAYPKINLRRFTLTVEAGGATYKFNTYTFNLTFKIYESEYFSYIGEDKETKRLETGGTESDLIITCSISNKCEYIYYQMDGRQKDTFDFSFLASNDSFQNMRLEIKDGVNQPISAITILSKNEEAARANYVYVAPSLKRSEPLAFNEPILRPKVKKQKKRWFSRSKQPEEEV